MARKKTTGFTSNGRCLAYLRVSTDQQASKGLSLMAQGDVVMKRAIRLGLTFKDCSCDKLKYPRPGYFVDAAESAYTTRFEKRPAGGKLLENLEEGDTVIVSRLDRGFRSVVDFITVTEEMTRRGVRFICCSPDIDLGTAGGRLFATVISAIAEWESSRKGERIRDALAQKKLQDFKPPVCEKGEKLVSVPSDWRPHEILSKSSKASKEPRPGKIHFYLRCSHRSSTESMLGIFAQADAMRGKASELMEANPNLVMGEAFEDLSTSALRFKLKERASGKLLHECLKDGDHVVFASLDRGFRSAADLAETCPDWISRGVSIHFVDNGMDMGTHEGRMMAGIMVAFAQFEAELGSDRAKEARLYNESRGKFCGGHVPRFWKIKKFAGEKKLIIHKEQLIAFRLVKFIRYHTKCNIEQALMRCEELHAKRENRSPIPLGGLGGLSKRSKLMAGIPDDYPRDRRGYAMPRMTRSMWNHLHRYYDQAMEDWRKHVEKMKEIRKQNGIEVFVPSKKTPRGWTQGDNPPISSRWKQPVLNWRISLRKMKEEYEAEFKDAYYGS